LSHGRGAWRGRWTTSDIIYHLTRHHRRRRARPSSSWPIHSVFLRQECMRYLLSHTPSTSPPRPHPLPPPRCSHHPTALLVQNAAQQLREPHRPDLHLGLLGPHDGPLPSLPLRQDIWCLPHLPSEDHVTQRAREISHLLFQGKILQRDEQQARVRCFFRMKPVESCRLVTCRWTFRGI
jgi:hypothetical protein